jgi:hypothetical protein
MRLRGKGAGRKVIKKVVEDEGNATDRRSENNHEKQSAEAGQSQQGQERSKSHKKSSSSDSSGRLDEE